ncbi:MAG: hypothetical protein IH859_09070, partial [Chloroflexi bacterium]|nr:hypothetical protein [Chloroflexota bacterium]
MSLFKDLDPANISKLLYISLLVAVVTIIWMYRLGEPIRGTKTNIILALELVRTEEIAKDILEDLDGTEIAAVRKITYVDFLFIPAYMLFLSNLWLLIIIRLRDHPWSGFFTLAGALFIIAAMVAGSFDLVENIY